MRIIEFFQIFRQNPLSDLQHKIHRHSPKVSHLRSGRTLLNREIFTTRTEANVLVADWMKEYNQFRPHGSFVKITST
jgi:hypothetical protein